MAFSFFSTPNPNVCALVFQLAIEFQFSSFCDWSIERMRMNLLLYCLVCACVSVRARIRFCIHISSYNVVRKSNEMCCNFEIQYVTETYTSNTASCTIASVRLFRFYFCVVYPQINMWGGMNGDAITFGKNYSSLTYTQFDLQCATNRSSDTTAYICDFD